MFPDIQPYKYHAPPPMSQDTPTNNNNAGAGGARGEGNTAGTGGGGAKVHAGTQTPVVATPSADRSATMPPRPVVVGEEETGVHVPPMNGAYGVASPPLPYYVKQKACESSKFANRVERRFLHSSAGFPVLHSSKEMMWDYPRSQKHRVRNEQPHRQT